MEKLKEEKKIDHYFMCIKCCVKSIITSRILQTEGLPSLLSNIKLDFTKMLLSLTTPTKKKVQSENWNNNNIKETSNTKKLAEKTTVPIRITETVCTKEGENNPFDQQEIQNKIK